MMMKIRFMLILAALLTMVYAVSAQPQPLTVTPPSGPHATNHTVTGTGLTPEQTYRFDVAFQESGETVFSADLTADSAGQVQIDLLTQESDPAGVYAVNLYDGETLIATGTITITAQIQ